MKLLVTIGCLALIALSIAAPPVAAQSTWTGTGVTPRVFTAADNWDPNWTLTNVPLRIDDSSDTTSPILTTDLTATVTPTLLYLGSLTSEEAFAPGTTTTGGKLTIQAGGVLGISGKIDVGVVGPVAGDNVLTLEGGTIVDGVSTGGRLVQGAGAFRIGVLNNSGTVNMTGGSRIDHLSGGDFVIGAMANGLGTVNMSDQAILAVQGTPLFIGAYPSAGGTAVGVLNMSGTSMLGVGHSNALYVGLGAGTDGTLKMEDSTNIGWFASSADFGRDGGVGKLEMYDSSHIYQNASEINFGYLGGAQGTLTMVGSAVDAGVFPSVQQRGVTNIGRDGGIGVANITNATYWAESNSVFVGRGPGGDGTLTIETTAGSVNQANLTVNGVLYAGYEASTGEINVVGNSAIVVNGTIAVGHWDGITSTTAVGNFNMGGGSVTVNGNNYVLLGMGGSGTWTQTGGIATINGPTVFGESGGLTGVLNLNGGVYSSSHLYLGWSGGGNPTGRINFNGGTLQVNTAGFQFADNGDFLSLRSTSGDIVVAIGEHGAIIDTNGANQSFTAAPFSHDSSGPAIDGGLKKIGLGTLALQSGTSAVLNCNYNGPTVVEQGTLAFNGVEISASSGVAVKSGATLAGYTSSTTPSAYYPATTVETGGTLAPSAVDQYNFNVDSLNLADNSNLHFAIDANGYTSNLSVLNNVAKVGADPITVNVTYSGTPQFDVIVLQTIGTLDSDITFALPGGLPTYDSTDAIHGDASLYTDYANGSVQLKAGGLLANVVPTWNDAAGGDWNDTGNWGTSPPNPYPQNGGDRAMFVQSLSAGTIPVNLNVSPTVSSMIFDSPMGESYQIDPSDSAKSITLDSSIAKNWYINVLSGSHAVNADIAMAAEDGQSFIKVPVGSHLTLGGALSNLSTAAGFTFQSTGTLTGNQWDNSMIITHGTLTLGGDSSFTGPLTMTGYGRLEMLQPTSLGTGTAALTLDGQLAYLGAPASPTTVTIDRNVVFAGAGFLNGIEVPSANVNLNFTGSLSIAPTANAFRKTGPGTLTFSNAGTNTLSSGDFQVEEGSVVFANGTFNKAQVNIGFQNGWGDFYVGDTVGKNASMTLQNDATLNNQGAFALGISGGVGSLDMYDSALLFQAATEMNIGYLGGAQGTLTMVGSAVDAGVYPTMQLRGTSMIGRDGGVGVANITNATYWSEWTGMYVGIGPAGNGSLTLETTAGSVNQALLVVNGPLHSGYEASMGEINVVGNSSVVVNGSIAVGHWVGITTPTAVGSFNVNGGSVAVNGNNYVLLGMGGTGTWNQNGGVATINGPTVFGEDGGLTGTLNLNGGVYSTSHLYLGWNGTGAPVGRINFDGGTLQVNTAGFQFGNNGPFLSLRSTTADFVIAFGAGGAIIDTNGANQSFSSIPFSHDSTGPAIDGGLRKIGEGLLHVLVKPTYTGNTTSENGLLYMAALDTPDADVLVTNDSSMAVYTLDAAAEPNLTANTVTVDSTATLYVEKTITANTVSVFDTATLTAKAIVADTLVIGGPGAANAAAVPEPATFVLLVFAALGLAAMGWRKK